MYRIDKEMNDMICDTITYDNHTYRDMYNDEVNKRIDIENRLRDALERINILSYDNSTLQQTIDTLNSRMHEVRVEYNNEVERIRLMYEQKIYILNNK